MDLCILRFPDLHSAPGLSALLLSLYVCEHALLFHSTTQLLIQMNMKHKMQADIIGYMCLIDKSHS